MPTLPQETIDDIVYYACRLSKIPPSLQSVERTVTGKRLSLTSKAFVHGSQAFLFEQLRINFMRPCSLWLDVLNMNPVLPGMVRSLVLEDVKDEDVLAIDGLMDRI